MDKKPLSDENFVTRAVTRAGECILLNLLWILFSLPVVTYGAATAALYDTVYYSCRKGERQALGRFLRSFRSNLKSGILPGLLYLGIVGAGGWGLKRIWDATVWNQVSLPPFLAAVFGVALLLGILSILLPLFSRFHNTFGGLLRNTVLLGIANLPKTLGLGLLNALSILLCVRFLFPLLILPWLTHLLGTRFLEPMFLPYMGEEEKGEAV